MYMRGSAFRKLDLPLTESNWIVFLSGDRHEGLPLEGTTDEDLATLPSHFLATPAAAQPRPAFLFFNRSHLSNQKKDNHELTRINTNRK
jgi:hypothetical protein